MKSKKIRDSIHEGPPSNLIGVPEFFLIPENCSELKDRSFQTEKWMKNDSQQGILHRDFITEKKDITKDNERTLKTFRWGNNYIQSIRN